MSFALPRVVIDPVCGMAVDPESAAGALTHARSTYYFCSRDCLNQFSAKIEALLRLAELGAKIGTVLRQEEITEEIEVIMLSSDALRRRAPPGSTARER